jgi:2-hydroxychromene-2-carboxylate isomerase
MWRDLERICADAGLLFRRPSPLPQNSVLATRIAVVGLNEEWGERFCLDVFRTEFGQGRSIDDASVLADVLSDLKVAPEPTLAAAISDENKLKLRNQTEQAQQLGVFGAPTFTTADGELFWGNDRLELALLWAQQKFIVRFRQVSRYGSIRTGKPARPI